MPNAPDCDAKAMVPGTGTRDAKVASRRTSGDVLMIPKQFGPTMRMPPRCARNVNSRWSVAPASPTSAKPDEITTNAPTPLREHWSTTSSALSAGTATTATSTTPGTSSRVGYAGTLSMADALGLIGYTGPLKPPAIRFRTTEWPMFCGARPAPNTATDRGRINRSMLRTPARHSRW